PSLAGAVPVTVAAIQQIWAPSTSCGVATHSIGHSGFGVRAGARMPGLPFPRLARVVSPGRLFPSLRVLLMWGVVPADLFFREGHDSQRGGSSHSARHGTADQEHSHA